MQLDKKSYYILSINKKVLSLSIIKNKTNEKVYRKNYIK